MNDATNEFHESGSINFSFQSNSSQNTPNTLTDELKELLKTQNAARKELLKLQKSELKEKIKGLADSQVSLSTSQAIENVTTNLNNNFNQFMENIQGQLDQMKQQIAQISQKLDSLNAFTSEEDSNKN